MSGRKLLDVIEVNRLGGCQGCQLTCPADHRVRGWRNAPGGMEEASGMACKMCLNALKASQMARKRKASDGEGDVKRVRCDVPSFGLISVYS